MLKDILFITLSAIVIVIMVGILISEIYRRNRKVKPQIPKRFVYGDGHYTEAKPQVGPVNPNWYTPEQKR